MGWKLVLSDVEVPEIMIKRHRNSLYQEIDATGMTDEEFKQATEVIKKREFTPLEVTIKWIGRIMVRHLNCADVNGKPTKQPKMTEHEKYFRIANKIRDARESGVVELDDDFEYLKKAVENVLFPIDEYRTELLVNIRKMISKAQSDKDLGEDKDKEE